MATRCLRWLTIAASLAGVPRGTRADEPPARSKAIVGSSARADAGTWTVVTYNVAGLPEGLSRARPTENLPLIGRLLNRYDLALVQEDFAYPMLLRRMLLLPHASPAFVRGDALHFGDGLSQFARLPFYEFVRETWTACHGIVDAFFDCLTPKGFTYSRQMLARDVSVDVYNLHMDAGRSAGDRRARRLQLEQLARAILTRSTGRAVLVGGDFNLGSDDLEALGRLEQETGLRDVCGYLGCPEPGRVDRILFRSSEALKLWPRSWRVDRSFVDAARRPLSDHLAVVVELAWRVSREPVAKAAKLRGAAKLR